ncbi:hypothetical protein [Roseomonas rosulenta]|nr:hypothetical protein [Roseomonas rosulenta]
MSDAPAISRFPAPPAIQDDDVAMARGLANALVLSLPLWALIGLAIAALV